MTESTYLDRMVEEKSELLDKTQKLRDFMKTDTFKEFDNYYQFLMKRQLDGMVVYLDALSRRIELDQTK